MLGLRLELMIYRFIREIIKAFIESFPPRARPWVAGVLIGIPLFALVIAGGYVLSYSKELKTALAEQDRERMTAAEQREERQENADMVYANRVSTKLAAMMPEATFSTDMSLIANHGIGGLRIVPGCWAAYYPEGGGARGLAVSTGVLRQERLSAEQAAERVAEVLKNPAAIGRMPAGSCVAFDPALLGKEGAPAPSPTPPPTPAPDPAELLAKADKLIEHASKMWEIGDLDASIGMAEKALALRQTALGPEHELTAKVQAMLDAARAKKAAEQKP